MKLLCYALHNFAPKLIAAPQRRLWMDDFADRHAYRCLPLSIANSHGWEVLCPAPIEVEWNGGPAAGDLSIRALKPLPGGQPVEHFCRSNFSRGIVTFHVDYLFRTDTGWDLLATGPVNSPKDNVYALTGIIEADWLPYPFTMNWQILRPGRVLFDEDEPFCFIFPVRKQALLDCEPEVHRLCDNAELSQQHEQFRRARVEFMNRFYAGDAPTLRQAWQRYYFMGQHPDGAKVTGHLNKLRLREPVDRRPKDVNVAPAALPPMDRGALAIAPADPRWEERSPLNGIAANQNDYNKAGRQRIDCEGHLLNKRDVLAVRSAKDLIPRDFVIAPEFLPPDRCEVLCQSFRELPDKIFRSMKIDAYWSDRFIWFADIAQARPLAARIMVDALHQDRKLVSEFYKLRAPIYPDLLQIVRWQAGMFMPPHADNANPDGSQHMMTHREFSGIVYLNDDYEGGQLYFTALNIVLQPARGMLAAFSGGFHHEHAVLRIDSGTRLTMPFFFTFDCAKADPLLLQHLSQFAPSW